MRYPLALTLAFTGLCFLPSATSAQTLATGDSRTVTQPTLPGTCKTLVAQFTQAQRATPPGTDDTARIQAALTSCAGTGQAVVLTNNGTSNAFYTGLITVNGEALVVSAGVVLYGSNAYATAAELILVEGANAGIYGPGTIDGRGDLAAISGTPRLVQTKNTTNLTVYNVTITQAKHPNLYLEGGNGATLWGVTINTPANRTNADGIDIDSITNVTVNNSSVTAGDDGIAIKTNSAAASNITVENSSFYGTHGLSIGSQTFDGVTNVLFQNNYVYGVDQYGNVATDDNGVRAKTDATCGGLTKEVYFHNTCLTQTKHFIVINGNYGACSGTAGTPQFQDIVVNGLYATNSVTGGYSEVNGYNAANLAQLYVANIQMDINTQQNDQYATVYLDNVNGWTPTGTGVTTQAFTLAGAVPTCNFTGATTATATVTGSTTTVAQGTAATLSATVTYTGKTGPTGAVTFTANGTTVTGTCVNSAGSNACTASFDTTGLSGTYPVTINEAADSAYAAATGTGSLVVTGGTTKTNPTITFTNPGPHTTTDAPFAVSATSNSAGAITYSLVSGPATVTPAGQVTLTGAAGTVVLQASQAANGNYNAGTAQTTFVVSAPAKTDPTITFTNPGPHTTTDAPFAVSATSNSTGAITYTLVSGPATVTSAGQVTLTGTSGTVVLQASQAANGNYNAGTAQTTFVVSAPAKINPTITFNVGPHTTTDAPFAVSATSNSAGAITYSLVSGPATVTPAGQVTLTGTAGTVVVQASQAANGNYNAGTAQATFVVSAPGKTNPTITFNNVGPHATTDAPFTVSATSNSTGAITYSLVSGPATVTPAGQVTLTGTAGTVVLLASQAANGTYNAGTAQASFVVTGTNPAPTIVFNIPPHTYGDAGFTIAATSNSTGPFTYTVLSGPATISGSFFTITGVGTVVVQASEAADANYAAATKTATFTVSPATLTVTANSVSRVYGAANPTFAGTVTGQKNGDTFAEAFTTAATAASPVGTYAIVPSATGANLADYTVSASNGTLTVTQAAAGVSLVPAATAVNTGQSDVLTVHASNPAATGTVTIFDNGVALTTVTLVNGTATYAATFTTAGMQGITTLYSGDANFLAVNSTLVSYITVSGGTTPAPTDFTFTTSGATTVAVHPGQIAAYNFVAAPGAGGYPGPVTFAVTGLPAGATATFTPTTIPAAGGTQTVLLSVQTSAFTAQNHSLPGSIKPRDTIFLALLLPMLAGYRFRRRLGSRLTTLLLLLATFTGAAAITGCTGGFVKPQQLTLNVTAVSGTYTHTQTVTLVIE